MQTKTIKKTITIPAPKEKVWDVLINDKFLRIWYSEFGEGVYAETDWKVGSKAVFKDKAGEGLVSKVIQNKPNELLSMEFQGIIVKGKEDYESEIARAVKGGKEIYQLKEQGGATQLAIETDMEESMYDSMSEAWDNALVEIKELSSK